MNYLHNKELYTITFNNSTMAKEVQGGYFRPTMSEAIFFTPFNFPAEVADPMDEDAEVFNDLGDIIEM